MYKINDLVIGTVTSIKPYALFLKFEDGSNGLLHISEISDSYIKDIEKYGSVGDQIKVFILTIDETNGFMRVSLKKVPKEEAFSTHQNIQKKKPDYNKDEFKPLEEKLPEWINETMKKVKED